MGNDSVIESSNLFLELEVAKAYFSLAKWLELPKLLISSNRISKNEKVYVALIADLVHAGHVRLLKQAASLGEVTVGLMTSKATRGDE